VVFAFEDGAVRSERRVLGFFEERVGELADGEVGLAGVVVGEGEEESDGGIAGEKFAGFLEGADGGMGLADGAERGAEADEGGVEVFVGEAEGDGAAVEGDGFLFVAVGVEGEGLLEESGGGCWHREIVTRGQTDVYFGAHSKRTRRLKSPANLRDYGIIVLRQIGADDSGFGVPVDGDGGAVGEGGAFLGVVGGEEFVVGHFDEGEAFVEFGHAFDGGEVVGVEDAGLGGVAAAFAVAGAEADLRAAAVEEAVEIFGGVRCDDGVVVDEVEQRNRDAFVGREG